MDRNEESLSENHKFYQAAINKKQTESDENRNEIRAKKVFIGNKIIEAR